MNYKNPVDLENVLVFYPKCISFKSILKNQQVWLWWIKIIYSKEIDSFRKFEFKPLSNALQLEIWIVVKAQKMGWAYCTNALYTMKPWITRISWIYEILFFKKSYNRDFADIGLPTNGSS